MKQNYLFFEDLYPIAGTSLSYCLMFCVGNTDLRNYFEDRVDLQQWRRNIYQVKRRMTIWHFYSFSYIAINVYFFLQAKRGVIPLFPVKKEEEEN